MTCLKHSSYALVEEVVQMQQFEARKYIYLLVILLNDIKIGSRCFENVAQFKYLGTTVTNQNFIQKEIKRSLNSGNVCYHSVQKFCLLVCSLKT
jgi:hypothetical protein